VQRANGTAMRFQELERNNDDGDGHDDAAPGQTARPISGGVIKNVN